ncbi:sugar ABC transporter permease [Mesorhizobium sp. CA18]|uniref:carbohydrate ABC transporter permease n=1 Tax=unclassified Mesorhizobium TaxID=325217 RepID=UPI001CCD02F2|nr:MULTISPECIES: sugar ABC transporter permease [unclassified Mesorhizobium]MBZ9736410.1 sugar ABC transporter permease [Mesorhizobium sp. CA9]MBZ9769221.1 sugar ABC transporter permease [Mesorhizobium sp. CA6]MBZ9825712.1 sugar ABC transporter permease [Mesorhizobium sp. CA18]MBZ9831806.1 sugar ABC transporter permease [Mesorhizobium sp. CA2]MBZ9839155.1 sugar ABC transporter permease [Mesorhizobium sp. CA3]
MDDRRATPRNAPPAAGARAASIDIYAPQWRNFIFVAPFLFFFTTLLLVPLFWGMWLSFHKADTFSSGNFVGFGNYIRLFHDKVFLQSVWNTFYFVLLTVPTLALIGLFLALCLNRRTRTAAVLRTLFFSSSVLSVTIVTLIWRIVFIPNVGLLSTIYGWFGATAPAFISDPSLAMIGIAIATVWWCIGLPMMLFLSALQQIPQDIYEAAALDNANRWQTLRSITLPSIKRTFVLVVIVQIVLQFQLFGQAWLMTRGGPNNLTKPIVLYIYDTAFRRWDLGMGAAASEVLFILILMAAMAQYLVTRNKAGQT